MSSLTRTGFVPLVEFMAERWDRIAALTLEHAVLVVGAMAMAITIGVGLGVLISYRRHVAEGVIYAAGIIMTVPSIAMLGFMIPLLGIGSPPAVAALVLYAQLPILRNTYTGIRNIDPAILEAAQGMGMRERQVLLRIKLPLALPVITAGIRTAVVLSVAIAAIAAYIGAGGLGELVFRGIARTHDLMVMAGAIWLGVLGIAVDFLLGLVERRMTLRSEGRVAA